ncbi:tripartite tricarboxylate transporter TctB family protein [uncultured Propionivibrio sp.]|uniref:tripartite tricarboxylate transporter TctB family protein n=1 Tax=uncultured Propionivibrio sp. TaxID=426737 RepID=UPI0029C0E7DA|nr:tripartite tricarboxylate transporter TctB family protein [uncultured Propionivibrio sp.]
MTDESLKAQEDPVLLPPDETTRRPRREVIGALLLMSVAAAFIFQALRMPFKDPAWEWYTAPNIFPLAMAVCLGLCAVFVAVRGIFEWRANPAAVEPLNIADSARRWGMGRFLGGVAMIGVLIFLLGKLSFYVLAPGSILVFGLVFRSDPWPKAIRASVIAAIFIVVFLHLISRIFGIVFP